MKKTPKPISDWDWNFEEVPDTELMACCYWEYARESEFIRDVRQRCMKVKHSAGLDEKKLHADLQRVQSIGYAANIFLRGFFCPPDGVLPDAVPLQPGEVHRLTGCFPKPWQALTKEERDYRATIPPPSLVDFVELVPFRRGIFLDARDIVERVESHRWQRDLANAEARRANPGLSDAALERLGKLQFSDVSPSVIYASGTEKTVVEINWGIFTNEEIIQSFREWAKASRPEDLPGPDGKGRNKARDWRVALERLALMRLLHQFCLRDLPQGCPKAWKLYGKREFYKERKRSGVMFHRLFHFLAPAERPLHWPTKGGKSK